MSVQTTNAPLALSGVAVWVKTRYAAWREAARLRRDFRRTVAELETLSCRELADLGLTRGDIRYTAKMAIYG